MNIFLGYTFQFCQLFMSIHFENDQIVSRKMKIAVTYLGLYNKSRYSGNCCSCTKN